MAIDFSSLGATPAKTGKIDFSAIGGVPAVGQDDTADDTTALGAAGRGAVSMLPLGNQAYSAIAGAAEKEPYLQERKELQKETQSDIENHEPARLVGQGAGLVAPALLTGGAAAPESMAGAVGQGAVMGAGFGVGNAIDTLASGGSGAKAAGNVALGAGLGGVGGALGQAAAGAAESAVPGLESFAGRKAAQSVGLGSDELGNMSPPEIADLGQTLIQKGIVKPGLSTQQMFDQAKALQDQYGDEIGKIGDKSIELGLTTDTKPLLDALTDKYQAAAALNNPDEMRAELFYKKGMEDIIASARQNGAERVAPDIRTDQPNSFVTFDQLQRLKKSYGNSAFMNGAVKNPAAADVYSQLSSGQKAIVNKAIDNPELPGQLREAMAGYSKMHPVVDGLQDVLGRERAGNLPSKGFGMVGKLIGQIPGEDNPAINTLTSLGLLGQGHPMWALGAATASFQNPRVMSGAAQTLANNLPGAAAKLPGVLSQVGGSVAQNMGDTKPVSSPPGISSAQNPHPDIGTLLSHPSLAKYKPGFMKNAAGAEDEGDVQKANAIQDFKNSQTIPGYAEDKDKAANEPVSNTNMAGGGVVPQRQGKQFNTSMAEQLQEFLRKSKESGNAKPR